MSGKDFNRFVPLKERQNIVDKTDETVVDSNGVIRDDVIGLVLNPKHYDGRKFTKIYKDGILALREIDIPALKVLLYFLYIMSYSEDIKFNLKDCMDFTGYKNKSYIYKAISNLIKLDILRRKEYLTYYLNPNMFYRGNFFKNNSKNRKK